MLLQAGIAFAPKNNNKQQLYSLLIDAIYNLARQTILSDKRLYLKA